MFVMAFSSGASMKGPFLTERAMLFRLPLHDELVGALVVPRLVSQCRLAPWGHRVVALDASLTTTMRVIDGVHHDSSNCRPDSHVADSSSLAERHVFMIQVADLADCRHAVHVDQPRFSGRQLHVSVSAFLGN